MKYEQRNPIPLPEGRQATSVESTFDTVFDWKYGLEKQNLMQLYEKGKALTWNANELPWDTNVDFDELSTESVENGGASLMNQLLAPPLDEGHPRV